MNESGETVFEYSTKVPPGQRGCLFILIFVMGAIALLIFGAATYLFMNAGSVEEGSTYLGDIGVGMMVSFGGMFPFGGFIIFLIIALREKTYYAEHFIYDDKIVYQEKFPKKPKRNSERILPFSEMNWSIIGNNIRYVPQKIKGYYQHEAFLLLNFKGDIHILVLREEEELNNWIKFLKERDLNVFYIDRILTNIYSNIDKIDFDALKVTDWDDSVGQKPLFEDTMEKVFDDWDPPFKNEEE